MSDVRLLVGPPSCTSPLTSRQSHHVSSPYFKQLIFGLWFDTLLFFTNFLVLGLQLRRPLRWSSIGAREGLYLLCSILFEPLIKIYLASRGGKCAQKTHPTPTPRTTKSWGAEQTNPQFPPPVAAPWRCGATHKGRIIRTTADQNGRV